MQEAKEISCDRDCFNCKFEDCILDDLNADDYRALSVIEKEILFPKTAQQKKIAAGKKAYYEANREKIAAGKKAYREANREKYNQYMREYNRKRRAGDISC